MNNSKLRSLPKMELLIEDVSKSNSDEFSHEWIKHFCNSALDKARYTLKKNPDACVDYSVILNWVFEALNAIKTPSLKPVINATGIALHTNLGRAVISEHTFDAIRPTLTQYNTLEYNVKEGRRGSRYDHIEEKICLLTGAEAALVVNNNASAVMLVLNTLANDKEVIVSRGELVEIGGSFRVPDVMKLSGCQLVEVGTTNKTHLYDYTNAVSDRTGLLMKVHTSNYRIVGFSESVSSQELYNLASSKKIPVYEDLGSGLMIDMSSFGLSKEPIVKQVLSSGIDVVSFSGDKLFGGAQCGLIVGKKECIDKMKKNQLLRAFRIDKFSLAIIEQTLKYYFNPEVAFDKIHVLRTLSQSAEAIHKKVNDFITQYCERLKDLNVNYEISPMKSEIGGGAMPLEQLDSVGLKFYYGSSASQVQKKLRLYEIPIIVTIENDCIVFDFRTIETYQYKDIYSALCFVNDGGEHAQ